MCYQCDFRFHLCFRPTSPAWPGGLYILLLSFLYFFIFFDNRPYSWELAQQAPGNTVPTVGLPAELIKYPHTFHPCCPPFLQGSKMSQILGQISTPIVFGLPYYWKVAIYRKSKTNLSRIDDRPTTTPNFGEVGPPNSENRWCSGYPKG